MKVSKSVAKIIEDNANLLDTQDYEKLYRLLRWNQRDFLTNMLERAGIDPLPHMENIVSCMYIGTDIRHLYIPPNIKTIGVGAFQFCKLLHNIQIGSGVTRIEEHAFDGCTSLSRLVIPSNVKFLGPNCIMSCEALQYVTIEKGIERISNNAIEVVRGTHIDYTGTKSDWDKIKKGQDIIYQCGLTRNFPELWDGDEMIVHCKDGDIQMTHSN